MNKLIRENIIRFIFIYLLQVLVLKRIDLSFSNFDFIHIIIYGYIIMMLPFRLPSVLVLIISFILGLMVDFFYHSFGVHAIASVTMGYVRMYLLAILEPYEGYANNEGPNLRKMGMGWFTPYVAILLAVHLFVYFSVDAFSMVYIFDIVMNTVFSLLPSMVLIYLLTLIFKAK